MKKILIALTVLLTLVACSKKEEQIEISGHEVHEHTMDVQKEDDEPKQETSEQGIAYGQELDRKTFEMLYNAISEYRKDELNEYGSLVTTPKENEQLKEMIGVLCENPDGISKHGEKYTYYLVEDDVKKQRLNIDFMHSEITDEDLVSYELIDIVNDDDFLPVFESDEERNAWLRETYWVDAVPQENISEEPNE